VFNKLRIRIAPTAVLLLVGLLLTDRSGICLAAIPAALIHECGHLSAAKLLRIPLRELRLDVPGARLDASGRMLSYGEEWLFCAAGPLFSLFTSAMVAPLWGVSTFAQTLSCVSLLLGGLNLLPIRSFDGGRMLQCFLSPVTGERAACAAVTVCSFLSLFLLWATAVYFLLKTGDGLSLFCFSVSLLTRFPETYAEG